MLAASLSELESGLGVVGVFLATKKVCKVWIETRLLLPPGLRMLALVRSPQSRARRSSSRRGLALLTPAEAGGVGIMMAEDGLVVGAPASSHRAPLPQDAWQLKPRQAVKRKHDGCDLSPPSEGEDYTSPDSATALLPTAPMPAPSAQQTTETKSSMLSPFLGGMSMRADATPGIGMTGRMGTRGMTAVRLHCDRRVPSRAGREVRVICAPRPRCAAAAVTGFGLPVAAPRDQGGSMMMSD